MNPVVMKRPISILLILGIVLVVNALVQPFLLRLDFSQGRQYTLGKATKDILHNLDEQVTVSAYFSGGLPPDIGKVRRDFQDLLVEYAALSKGRLDFEFIDPKTDDKKQEAAGFGIQPLMINVREKDQVKQQQAFLGAVIKMGARNEIIPFVEPGASMEYNLSSAIKKLSVEQKPAVAFLTGHGEPSLNDLAQAARELSSLYEITTIDLNTTPKIPDSIKVVVLLAPKDVFPAAHLDALDAYLASGGQMVLGINRVEVNMQAAMATGIETGLETWLQFKGVEIDTGLVVDVQCGAVTVPQYLGMIQINTQVKFPYLPLANTFADHPATRGLSQVLFPYVSPIRFIGDPQSKFKFEPIVFSSTKSGIQKSPVMLQVADKKWLESDFPLSNVVLGGVLSGSLSGKKESRIIVFGDGDFPQSGQQGRAMTEDNVSLLVNSVDWLGDDSGLLNLRSKAVVSRPLKAEFLLEESNGKRQTIKWLNVGFPVLMAILAGIFIQQHNARVRKRRMSERYEFTTDHEQ